MEELFHLSHFAKVWLLLELGLSTTRAVGGVGPLVRQADVVGPSARAPFCTRARQPEAAPCSRVHQPAGACTRLHQPEAAENVLASRALGLAAPCTRAGAALAIERSIDSVLPR